MTDPKIKQEFVCKGCGRKYATVIVGNAVFVFDAELMQKVIDAVIGAIES